MLRDTPDNRRAWSPELTHFDDPQLVAWRKRLSQQFTCGYFDAEIVPEVLPSITRQLLQWDTGRKRKLYMSAAAAFAAICILCATIYASHGLRGQK